MTTSIARSAEDERWLREPERGNAFAIGSLFLAYRLLGRGFARAILGLVSTYYALAATPARRASQAYLQRMFGRSSFAMTVRHIRHFAECALDRALFAAGKMDGFIITRHGQAHLRKLAQARQGALLLGAHIGSFEAMRSMSQAERIPINVLVHFRNARRITALLRTVAPEFDGRIIEIDPAAPHWALTVADRIAEGELVAMLGDRVGLGERTTDVNFMGAQARLPVGPYVLAAALGCPVYLTFGLYHPPRSYALYCEPFCDRVELPRQDRAGALAALAQRYADRVEFYLRHAPYNWFNFYDFWK